MSMLKLLYFRLREIYTGDLTEAPTAPVRRTLSRRNRDADSGIGNTRPIEAGEFMRGWIYG